MNAKDTVINRFEIERITNLTLADAPNAGELHINYEVAKAQAEISFKAGQESMSAEETEGYFRGRADGITIGRFEVVDWMNKNPDYLLSIKEWQVKLKEWGINEIRG